MANILSFFKTEKTTSEKIIKEKKLSNKEKEIRQLIGNILEAKYEIQQNIPESISTLINEKELKNNTEYNSLADYISTFETLEVKSILKGKVQFKFTLFLESMHSELPIELFYDLMIDKKLLKVSQKKEIKTNKENISQQVHEIV